MFASLSSFILYTPRLDVADWKSREETVTEDFDAFNESTISPMAQSQLMQSMAHQSADLARHMRAQMAQAIGGASELLGMGLEALGVRRLRLAKALRLERIGAFLHVTGRRLGALGGFAMAVLDFAEGWGEIKNGNPMRGVGYFSSAIFGLAFIAALFLSAFILAGLFFIVAMVIAYFLESGRPDNIQQWLERCIWGNLKDERYESEKVEQEQLNVALGAV